MRQSYFYDHKRDRKLPALPDEIPHGNGIRRRPHITDEQYRDYGIITTLTELIDIPDGYMIDPDTFRIEFDVDLNTAREVGEVIPIPEPPEPEPDPRDEIAALKVRMARVESDVTEIRRDSISRER